MANFLLVHGSWHGAWCWERLAPRLRERGHRVDAIDLPAHGSDRTPAFRVTLGSYSRRIRETAAGLESRPILVGHSMGGLAIGQAASDAAELFSALVYLCAFVPLPGESLLMLSRRDPDSLIPDGARLRPTAVAFQPERAQETFYDGCSEADVAWAKARLRPDPLLPLLQRAGDGDTGSLPRGYIECTRDRAISLSHQRAMAGRVAFDRVATLETDHSPFLSAPDELARELEAMAGLAS